MISEIWIGLGLDPIKETIIVMTIASTEKEAKDSCDTVLATELKDADITAWKVFNFLGDLNLIKDWLIECKISKQEIAYIFKQLGGQIERAFNDDN